MADSPLLVHACTLRSFWQRCIGAPARDK